MKRAKIAVCLAVLLAIAALPKAEAFTLTGNQHLDITTSYDRGYLWDFSTADSLSGGSVTWLDAYDNSTVNLSGGSVTWLDAYDSSTVNMPDGTVKWLKAYDSGIVNMSGGNTLYLKAYNSGIVNMSGGNNSYL
jgi:hypothetical protein